MTATLDLQNCNWEVFNLPVAPDQSATQSMLIENYYSYKYFAKCLCKIYEPPCFHGFLVIYSNTTFTEPDSKYFISISRHSVMNSGVFLWLTTHEWNGEINILSPSSKHM